MTLMSPLFLLVLGAAAPPAALVPLPPPTLVEGVPFGPAAQGCKAKFPLTQRNIEFTATLRRELEAAGFGPALKKKTLAVAVVDLTPKQRVHYAGINDDHMIYAASLPKIAAVLAVAQGAKEGRFRWTDTLAHDADAAINNSDNRAASRLVKRATVPYIEEVMRRPGYCFYGDARGGLWLGRGFGGGGPTHRDPVKNTVHGATARQVARYYTLLDKGLLVGPVGNQRILTAMAPPRLHHKFVKAVDQTEGAKVLARKSGTWRTYHSDSAIIEHGDARYVVVALSDRKNGGADLTKIALIVDRLVVAGRHRAPVAPPPPAATGTTPP